MHRTSTRLQFARRKRLISENIQLPVQRRANLKGRGAPYADPQTTNNATTCSPSKITVHLSMDEKEEGKMMVVKVGKAGKAATRMVKETSRSRKPRNALPGKSNADTGASATQLEIRVNATTGILWQNGKICYSNTKRTCGPGKIVLKKAKRAMAKARMTKAKRVMAKARMIKAGKGRAKVVPVEQSSPVIQSRPRPSIRLKKHQRNLKPLPRDCLQAQTERGPLTKR